MKFKAVPTDYDKLKESENAAFTGVVWHNRVNHQGTKEMYVNAENKIAICRHGSGNWAAYELNENDRIGYEIEWIASLQRLKAWMREENNRFPINGSITLTA